jgi:hypothetical protein
MATINGDLGISLGTSITELGTVTQASPAQLRGLLAGNRLPDA